jgi:hypothetical protein
LSTSTNLGLPLCSALEQTTTGFDEWVDGVSGTATTSAFNIIDAAVAAKADKSTITTHTLVASSWSSNTYTLSVTGATLTNVIEILPGSSITNNELEALQGANIQDGGQNVGNITLSARGTVPTIDIQIRVIVRGDL